MRLEPGENGELLADSCSPLVEWERSQSRPSSWPRSWGDGPYLQEVKEKISECREDSTEQVHCDFSAFNRKWSEFRFFYDCHNEWIFFSFKAVRLVATIIRWIRSWNKELQQRELILSCEQHKFEGEKAEKKPKKIWPPRIKPATVWHSDSSVRWQSDMPPHRSTTTTTQVPNINFRSCFFFFFKAWAQASKSECRRRKKRQNILVNQCVHKRNGRKWSQYLSPFLGRVFLPQCGPLWERNTSDGKSKGNKEAREHVAASLKNYLI